MRGLFWSQELVAAAQDEVTDYIIYSYSSHSQVQQITYSFYVSLLELTNIDERATSRLGTDV